MYVVCKYVYTCIEDLEGFTLPDYQIITALKNRDTMESGERKEESVSVCILCSSGPFRFVLPLYCFCTVDF